MTTDKDRAEFEKWYAEGVSWSDGTHKAAWLAWQARSRSGAVPAELCERICAAIKAVDEKSVDESDYMLDSDDCIRIVREQFAAAPEPPQGAKGGCLCQGCGERFTGDLLVPDDVWLRIKPAEGLLCARCIVDRAVNAGIWTAARATDIEAPRSGDAQTIRRGMRDLEYVIERLRETGMFRDEEGDATDSLESLLEALRGTAPPADARDAGANYNEGTVTVPVKDLREVLDGNLAAAEDALPQAGNSIDFIEARGGADADEASDRIAYHLFYAMIAAEKLRPLLPQISDDRAMGATGGGQ